MVERRALWLELRLLRKGPGVTPGRLLVSRVTCELLGRPTIHDALPCFVAQVQRLPWGYRQAALLNAYAIGVVQNARWLTGRRNDFALSVGHHPDWVELRENEAIEALTDLLLGRPINAAVLDTSSHCPECGQAIPLPVID